MALSIKWVPKAARQLETIVEYIAEDSPRYAAIFAKRVMQTIRSVPTNPRIVGLAKSRSANATVLVTI